MLLQMQVWAFMLMQEAGAPGWDFRHLWEQMGGLAKAVVIVMFLMSAWSIGVMIDRVMAFSAARKQSREFAPAVAGALREGKLDEAIKIADRYKKSHLAKVVVAGLQEFQAHQGNAEISGEEIEASGRALERSEAIVQIRRARTVGASRCVVLRLRHVARHGQAVRRPVRGGIFGCGTRSGVACADQAGASASVSAIVGGPGEVRRRDRVLGPRRARTATADPGTPPNGGGRIRVGKRWSVGA